MIRVVTLSTNAVTTLTLNRHKMIQWDLTANPTASTIVNWPSAALTDTNAGTIGFIDGVYKCYSPSNYNGNCYTLAYSEYNDDTGKIYAEFQKFTPHSSGSFSSGSGYFYSYSYYSWIFIFNPATQTTDSAVYLKSAAPIVTDYS